LVTGDGFIGSYVVERLLRLTARVSIADNAFSRRRKTCPAL